MLIYSNIKVITIALEYNITGKLKNSQSWAHPNPLEIPSSKNINSGLLYKTTREINMYINIDILTGYCKIRYIYYVPRFFVEKMYCN